MTAGAAIRLVARREGSRIVAVSVLDPRPQAADTLVGRTVDEAMQAVAGFSDGCSRAHAVAATAACAAAGAAGASRDAAAIEERKLATEAAQDHLRRLMLDWPTLFGHTPRGHRCATLQHRLARIGDARAAYELGGDLLDLVAIELLGGFFRATREPSGLREFVERARRGGAVGATLADLIEMGSSTPDDEAVPLLPALSAANWADALGGPPPAAFCRAPTLSGHACETGVLARHADSMMVRNLLTHGHRIAARLFARVVDLADCASRLRHPLAGDMPALVDAAPLGDGAGLGCVETACGLLMHAVRLEGDRVADYAIVAPADWNFHPDGAFMHEGAGWEAASGDAAMRRLQALALSLDPCTGYEVDIEDAADA